MIAEIREAMRRLEAEDREATLEFAGALLAILNEMKPRLQELAGMEDPALIAIHAMGMAERLRQLLRPALMAQAARTARLIAQAARGSEAVLERAFGRPFATPLIAAAFQAGMMPSVGDSPVLRYLARYGQETVEAFRSALLASIGAGLHPEDMARSLRRALGITLARATTLARTEMMRTWRNAFYAVAQANPRLILGYQWTAKLDGLTCAACAAMHGQIFRADMPVHGHPNCRCVPIPIPAPLQIPDKGFEPALALPLDPASLMNYMPRGARQGMAWPRLIAGLEPGPFGLQIVQRSIRSAREIMAGMQRLAAERRLEDLLEQVLRHFYNAQARIPILTDHPLLGPSVPAFVDLVEMRMYIRPDVVEDLAQGSARALLIFLHEAAHVANALAPGTRTDLTVFRGYLSALEEYRVHYRSSRLIAEIIAPFTGGPEQAFRWAFGQAEYHALDRIMAGIAIAIGKDPEWARRLLDATIGLRPLDAAYLLFRVAPGDLAAAAREELARLIGAIYGKAYGGS